MDTRLEKNTIASHNYQSEEQNYFADKDNLDSVPKSVNSFKRNSLSNNSSIEIKPSNSLNASADGEYEDELEEEEEEEGYESDANNHLIKEDLKAKEPPPKVYSSGELLLNKFFGLISMLILFSLVTIIYGTYLFWHLSPQLASSNVGPNMRFWKKDLWEDPLYSKGMTSFIVINIVLFWFLVALYRSAFTNPGNIPDDLKTPELDFLQLEKVSEIAGNYSFSSRISEEDSDMEKKRDERSVKPDPLKDPSHMSFTTIEEINIQGKQGENIVKRPVKDKLTKKGEDKKPLPKLLNDTNIASKKFKEAFLNIVRNSVEHKNKEGHFGKPRYCQTCKGYKPDRCHHCSLCNKCILKMDHHCPFVNNCIGFFNYKYFMLMLLYSSFMLIYIGITMFDAVHFVLNESQSSFTSSAYIMIVYTVVILLGLIVTSFMMFHFWMILRGLTTIEFREKLSRRYTTSPYDVDSYENFKAVFGKNPLLWFLPFRANIDGLGLKYKVRKTATEI